MLHPQHAGQGMFNHIGHPYAFQISNLHSNWTTALFHDVLKFLEIYYLFH